MTSREIRPLDSGGVKIIHTDDNDDTYTLCLSPPKNGVLEYSASADGTVDIKTVQEDGTEKKGTIDPAGGSTSLGV